MNFTAFAAQANSLALSPDHASVPERSPATSIVLAEAVRRSASFLPGVIGTSKVGLDPQVSLALTPTGPLVYQWLG